MCTETIVSCQPTRMYAMKKITALASLLFSLIGSSWAGDGQWQALNYSSNVAGLDSNPGCAVYSPYEGSCAGFPHSMEYFNLPLRSLMSGPDCLTGARWNSIEHHRPARPSGGAAHPARYPGEPTGILQYLLDAGLTTYRYDDYDNNGISLMPDWNDSRLIDALGRFIAALARVMTAMPASVSLPPACMDSGVNGIPIRTTRAA